MRMNRDTGYHGCNDGETNSLGERKRRIDDEITQEEGGGSSSSRSQEKKIRLSDSTEESPCNIAPIVTSIAAEVERATKERIDKETKPSYVTIPIGKIEYFFPQVRGVDMSRLQLTQEAVWSITPHREAERITGKILRFYEERGRSKKSVVVTDGTSCVGGNTLSFVLHGIERVNAVEVDVFTREALKNNLSVYGFDQSECVNVVVNGYEKVYADMQQDCVFLDPPWGGNMSFFSLSLFLSFIHTLSHFLLLFE
jgi:predicted RNA methylase